MASAALCWTALSVLAFSAPKKSLELLSPTNATQLKAVFFSGDPWLVQCGSKTDLAAAATDATLGAHEVVELAMPKLSAVAKVGLLDCAKKLPSGKSTLDRFKLDAAIEPTLMFAANGNSPVQLAPSMLAKHGLASTLFPTPRQQAGALAALVKSRSEKKALTLTKSQHLHEHCLKKKYCALLLLPRELSTSSEAATTLRKLLAEFRSVAFATVNAARYELSLAKHLPQPANPKQPQLVGFKSQTTEAADSSSSSSSSKDNSKSKKKGAAAKKALAVGAKAHRGEFDLSEVRGFLQSLTSDSLELTPLKKAPTIRWRRQEKSGGGGSEKGGTGKKAYAEGRSKPGGTFVEAGGNARGRQKQQQQQASKRKPQQSSSSKGGGGGGGEGEVSDEQRRRQKMAEEEEEAYRSMFEASPDEDDDGGEDGEEEEIDLDEEAEDEAEPEEGGEGGDDGEGKEEL